MQPGQILEDARSHVARFRVDKLLAEGRHYQIALGQDTLMEDKLVCLKTIDYPVEMLEDADYVAGRRQALEAELEFLTVRSHMAPEPLDMLYLAGSPAGGEEPVLVYEYQHGDTLLAYVKKRSPQGMPPAQALAILRELTQFARTIHAEGYIFRDFDPRHVIIGLDEVVQVVGCGNAVTRGEKMNVYKMNTNPCYTAPEIRREISGKVVKQACDTYSLGCLLSFMLTGIEPRPMVESPLDHDAYDMLRQRVPAGYRLLIARCLQPLAQKRFKTPDEMLAFLREETLPEPTTDGFGLIELPAPWDGPEGMDNRALRSKISPGPLVSEKQPGADTTQPVPPDTLPAPRQGQSVETSPVVAPKSSNKKILIAVVATLLVFALFVLFAVIAAIAYA